MTVRISELNELSGDLAQGDLLPIVDLSGGETKKIQAGNFIAIGISGAPSSFIDLAKLNQSSTTKLAANALATTGVGSGTYGNASTVPQFTVNSQGLVTFASGVPIVIAASGVTGLAPVATSGTYASLTGLPALGSIASQSAGNVAISGGTISGATISVNGVTISGGTIVAITDLAIADGGTGASTASDARTNLGLVIGTNVQAYSSVLSGVAGQFTAADQIVYASASGVVASTPFTAFGRSIVSGSTANSVRSTLGLGSIAIQEANNVAILGGAISGVTLTTGNATISGGTISGITDLAVADGGTGASTALQARANLGLAIGTNVQAYSSVLSGVASRFTAADEVIYASASGVIASAPFTSLGRSIVSGSTASDVRGTLGLGSMAVQNAGLVTISGGTINGITDLAVTDGGTGASTASGARSNLGLVIGTNVQAYDAGLASIAGLTTSVGQFLYTTASDTYTTGAITDFTRTFLASGTNGATSRSYLGVGAVGALEVVTSSFIATGAVGSGALADSGVTSVKIASGNVITTSIADSAVTTAKINNDAITAAKVADNSVTIVGANPPISIGSFIGQQYVDSVTNFEYTWNGSAWQRLAGIASIAFSDSTPLSFTATYPDAFSATITTSLDNQTANTIFAGPSSGSASAPSFRALASTDLPIATSSTRGGVLPGAGLSVAANGALNHSNSTVAGTYAGPVTIDAQGHIVSALANLQASNIPNLDASKITTGTFTSAFLAPNSVTASQLADYGIAQVSESAPAPEFAGQWWINPNDRSAFIWVGEVTPVPNGYWLNLGYGSPTQINLRFGGTYNASGNTVASINNYGIEAGLTVGQGLSAPNTANNGVYLIVTASGVGSAPAPADNLAIGNWVLSQGIGATWTKVNLSSAVAGVGDQDVLVNGAALVPTASGVASQEDLNAVLWARAQIANTSTAGIVRASSEIVVASGTGIMTIGTVDDGSY